MLNFALDLKDFIRAWLLSLAGFLVGEYGAGLLLNWIKNNSGIEAMLQMAWMPWLLAPVLGTIAAILGLLPKAWGRARWQDWVASVAVVPIGALIVTVVVTAIVGAHGSRIWIDGATQVAIAILLGLLLGVTLKSRSEREGDGEML